MSATLLDHRPLSPAMDTQHSVIDFSLEERQDGKFTRQPFENVGQSVNSGTESLKFKPTGCQVSATSASKSLACGGETPDHIHYKEDWEDKREVITTLYASMSLGQLMDEMQQRYGFHAKRYMYLRRIKDWGIQKNVKAAEKEAAINEFEKSEVCSPSGKCTAIPVHKIQRHLRRQKKDRLLRTQSQEHDTGKRAINQGQMVVGNSVAARAMMDSHLRQRYNSISSTSGKFIFSPLERSSEIFLATLQVFMEVRSVAFEQDRSTDGRLPTMVQHNKFQHLMFEHLEAARLARCFNHFKNFIYHMDRVCEMARDVLRDLHWTLVPDLLCGLHSIWTMSAKQGIMFWRFFTEMAKTVLSDNHSHCLIQILNSFPDVRGQPQTFDAASRIMLRAADKIPSSDVLLKLTIQQYAPQFHLTWGLFSYAHKSAWQSFLHCLDNFGPVSPETQFAALQLSDAQFFDRKPEAAKATTAAALQACLDNNSKPNVMCLKLAIQMSTICCHLRLMEDTRHYCSLGKSWTEELDLLIPNAFEYTYFCEMLRLVHDLESGELESPPFSEASPFSKYLRWSTCHPASVDFSRLIRSTSEDGTDTEDDFNEFVHLIMANTTATVDQVVVGRTVSGHHLFTHLSPPVV